MDQPIQAAPTDQNPPAPKPPPASETDHLLSDLHKQKARTKELEDQLKTKNEDDLRKNNQWKELADAREQEIKSLKERDANRDRAFIESQKHAAIRTAAMAAGIRKEALEDLELLPLREVTSETTSTGKVLIHGVDAAIEAVKRTRPYWFGTGAPAVNMGTPEVVVVGGQKITLEQVAAAQAEAKKTGNWTAAQALTLQYKNQG